MIGDGQKVERLALKLEAEAARVVDRLSPRVAVGVVGFGADRELVGVEGVARVDVEIAEVGVTQRAGRGGRVLLGSAAGGGGSGEESRKYGGEEAGTSPAGAQALAARDVPDR